mmetsp:Transcript_44326/g.103596  ORF Transcript_44326/g.103596 Transcript_44326/m.103596 type:complete len:308 (+) Transcript_44326:77-1000(+)
MFANKSFSNVGRKTAQSIDTLKKRLGVDAEIATKPTGPTVATRALSSSVSDSSLPTGSTTSTQDLVQRFSRRKVKSFETKQGKVEDSVEVAPLSASHVRQVAPLRNTSAFRSLGREELDKRIKSDEVPPVGSYSPKDDCTAALSRVKHPPPHGCSFASREITRSRRIVLAEQLRAQGQPYEHLLDNPGRELPEGLPDNPLARKKQIVFVNMSKQLPRPDLTESANIVYHDTIAISSSGFEEAHKKCAKFGKFYRQPCYPISLLPRSEKTQESFTQPGEFNVNLNFVRPRLAANMEFRKRPGRKDLLE